MYWTRTHRFSVGVPHLNDAGSIRYDELLVGEVPGDGGEEVVAVDANSDERAALTSPTVKRHHVEKGKRRFRQELVNLLDNNHESNGCHEIQRINTIRELNGYHKSNGYHESNG